MTEPRIALVVSAALEPARAALMASRDLIGAGIDPLLIGPVDRICKLAREMGGSEPKPVPTIDQLGALLRECRKTRVPVVISPKPTEGAEAAAERLLQEGRIDGIVLSEPTAPVPWLRIREGVRIIEAYPTVPLHELPDRVSPEGLAEIARAGRDLLRALGRDRPRMVLFDVPGLSGLEGAVQAARDRHVNLAGPFSARDITAQRADALLACTEAQAELPLALLGTGIETTLLLDSPWAWPADPTPASLVITAQRLATTLLARGSLVGESDRPVEVKVQRVIDVIKNDADRCPYCHRLLIESPDDRLSRPGPPVVCSVCGTGHHRDCLQEHGRCTVLGCKSTVFDRLGVRIALVHLGTESPQQCPFIALEGDAGTGPSWLRVETPIDDPRVVPLQRGLELRLLSPNTRRGDILQGYVEISAPREFRVRGGTLRLRASLTTRKWTGTRNTARTQPILDRQASFVGEAPASALGRLQDGVVSLFGSKQGLSIPVGIRRYPFSFVVPMGHPRTVLNRQGELEEQVRTRLEAVLDTQSVGITLEVS